MDSKKFFYPVLILIAIFTSTQGFAQKTLVHTDADNPYKIGLELFDKEKYGSAEHQFQKIIDTKRTYSSEIKDNAEYYAAVCAMELYHPDAEYKLTNFIQNHPEHNKIPMAHYRLGKWYFKQKSYRRAIENFEKTDPFYLNRNELSEFYFKSGFSYFSTFNYEKAQKAFYEIKEGDGKYAPSARYYYSHIAYLNKNYETALQGFLKLKDSETFAKLVPYYIVQIYYLQENYDELLRYATPILDSLKPQNEAEINHIIGDAYYKKAKYNEAIPYLEEYHRNSSNVTRDDSYELAFALYKNREYSRAITNFEKVTDGNDSLAQNALYLLADCFIKTSKKQSARNAFQSASKMAFSKTIQEDALYNYAKLSYELASQPMAVFAFLDYQKKYPNSNRQDEINELLAQSFLTTKNYKDALDALEKINIKNDRVKSAYQRAAYYRAIELYNNNSYPDFFTTINKSLQYPIDKNLEAQAYYWMGEVYYKKENFDAAVKNYSEFIFHPKAVNLSFYNNANYNIGYCHFKLEDYEEATTWFRKYLKDKEETDKLRSNDANLRIGDCYYVTRDYHNAVEYYDKAIASKAASTDYAIFQKALILGLLGKHDQKISTLNEVLTKYKKSKYYVASLYETAEAELLTDNDQKSLQHFQELITTYPNSDYVKKALLKTGLAYRNMNDDKKALAAYEEVINKYPSTPEAKDALVGIKTIAVDNGDASEYLKRSNESVSAQDSITYEAALTNYTKGECDNAVKSFQMYLDKFPSGIFAINANFYKAECEMKAKNFEKALIGYDFVANKPKSTFTEKALLTAANLYFKQKQYKQAQERFAQLEKVAEKPVNIQESFVGRMRSFRYLNNLDSASIYATKLLGSDKVSAELVNESHFIIGKSAFAKDSLNQAQREFAYVYKNSKSAMGAESKYTIALIQFKQKKYAESQKTIFEIINQLPSYDFWIAKSFILLGDSYFETNDLFQAKQTYKSIIDNYESESPEQEDLKALAQSHYDKVIEQENIKKAKELKEKQEKEERERKLFEESNKIIEPTSIESTTPATNPQ